jgi:hypothetical protein
MFWPSPLVEMSTVIGVRIVSPYKGGVGKFWPSPLLAMPSMIGFRVSGQRLCRFGQHGS